MNFAAEAGRLGTRHKKRVVHTLAEIDVILICVPSCAYCATHLYASHPSAHYCRFVVFGIALVAFILSSNTVNSCRYLITEPDGMAIGLYGYEDPTNVDRVCQSISFMKDSAEEDIFADEDSWKAAQALGTAGSILGGFSVLFMFLGFFCNWCASRMCFKFLFPLMFIMAGFCTILTNIAFNVDMCSDLKSEGGAVTIKRACTSSEGNASATGAFILYLIAGISMFWCMTPWETPMYKFVDELSTESTGSGGGGSGAHSDDKAAEPTEGLMAEDHHSTGMEEQNV